LNQDTTAPFHIKSKTSPILHRTGITYSRTKEKTKS